MHGWNRVVISVPPELNLKDILQELVEDGYLESVEDHFMSEGHCVIKRDDSKDACRLIQHLNEMYGYIADIGYTMPELCPKTEMHDLIAQQSKLQLKSKTTTLGLGHGHGIVHPNAKQKEKREIRKMTQKLIKKTSHIAVVQNPQAFNPNEHYAAYRREHDHLGFPVFHRVDIESTISYACYRHIPIYCTYTYCIQYI